MESEREPYLRRIVARLLAVIRHHLDPEATEAQLGMRVFEPYDADTLRRLAEKLEGEDIENPSAGLRTILEDFRNSAKQKPTEGPLSLEIGRTRDWYDEDGKVSRPARFTAPLSTEEGAAQYFEYLCEVAREVFEESKEHPPTFVLFALRDEYGNEHAEPVPVVLSPSHLEGTQDKNALVQVVHAAAEALRAVAVAHIVEAWSVKPSTEEERQAFLAWREHHVYADLQTYPGCTECLWVSLEHGAHGTRAAQAAITRDAEGRPTVGPWRTQSVSYYEGRFAEMLPVSAYGSVADA